MNSLERVVALLGGQPVDRPAYALLLSLYGARLTRASLKDHYSDPQVYLEGQVAVWERFQPDLLFGPFAFPLLAEAFGGTLHPHATQPPTLAQPPYASAAEALDRWSPEPTDHPAFRYMDTCIRLMARRFGGEVPVIPSLPSPADLPVFLLGAEGWLDTLLTDPIAAQALLERASTFCVAWGRQLSACGGTALGLTANFSNPDVLPLRLIQSLTLPALRGCFAQLPGPLVLHHGGCRLAPHLAWLGGLPNVAGYLLDSRDDLATARLQVGPGPLLLGGFNGPDLEDSPVAQVNARCLDVLSDRHTDPSFILASAGADVPWRTPPEVLEAVRDAAISWRGGGPVKARPTCIACSIFRREIEAIQATSPLDVSVRYLSSMLHMVPEKLEAKLQAVIQEEKSQGKAVVLGFGDCCARMLEMQAEAGLSRTEGINCCEIILGRERYRSLRRSGAFFLLPEWARRWREVFEKELGLSAENAQDLMGDMHTRLIYLDTGLMPIPEQELRAASAYTGLPWEVMAIDLGELRAALAKALPTGGAHD